LDRSSLKHLELRTRGICVETPTPSIERTSSGKPPFAEGSIAKPGFNGDSAEG
jgi:hypothetical protein